MSWFEVIETGSEEYFDILTETGFEVPLNALDTVTVLQIVAEVLKSRIATFLFEGLAKLEIDSTTLKMQFRYSRNEERITKVEEAIGRQELNSHRITFIMYVFATIDLKFKLDQSLPDGFRQSLDLPTYIG